MSVFLIGDVHGKSEDYLRIVRNVEQSIQLGDMGFDYTHLVDIDSIKHRVLGGNHDNYPELCRLPNYLGNWGCYKGIFFVRGAFSIDWQYRTSGRDIWREQEGYNPAEEITAKDCQHVLSDYISNKPDIVISHTCPLSVKPLVVDGALLKGTLTGRLLESMLRIHRPKQWIFGHFHRTWTKVINGTAFRCLDELETYEIPMG